MFKATGFPEAFLEPSWGHEVLGKSTLRLESRRNRSTQVYLRLLLVLSWLSSPRGSRGGSGLSLSLKIEGFGPDPGDYTSVNFRAGPFGLFCCFCLRGLPPPRSPPYSGVGSRPRDHPGLGAAAPQTPRGVRWGGGGLKHHTKQIYMFMYYFFG